MKVRASNERHLPQRCGLRADGQQMGLLSWQQHSSTFRYFSPCTASSYHFRYSPREGIRSSDKLNNPQQADPPLVTVMQQWPAALAFPINDSL